MTVFIPDPDFLSSRILDLGSQIQQQQIENGSTNLAKLEISYFFWTGNEEDLSQLARILTQTFFNNLS